MSGRGEGSVCIPIGRAPKGKTHARIPPRRLQRWRTLASCRDGCTLGYGSDWLGVRYCLLHNSCDSMTRPYVV